MTFFHHGCDRPEGAEGEPRFGHDFSKLRVHADTAAHDVQDAIAVSDGAASLSLAQA